MNTKLIKLNWFSLLQELKVDRHVGQVVFTDLVNAHCQLTRHYHNLSHVSYILYLVEEVEKLAVLPSVIQLSAWFHDYVYIPQRNDNEIKSAIYAEQTLKQLGIPLDLIQLVRQIILSTQKHQPVIDSIDNLIFLDIDLAILGTPSDRYFKYVEAIRLEYSWLGDRDYELGRKQVLDSFLARKRIYYTDYFYQKLELRARENLKAEIELYK